jgi:amyloid beta precursor protein binding protein 1
VGSFTTINDKKITEADLGVNSFLGKDSVGKPYAERTAALPRN